jgi:hypothetical protein
VLHVINSSPGPGRHASRWRSPDQRETRRWRRESEANPSLLIAKGLWDDCGAKIGLIRARFVENRESTLTTSRAIPEVLVTFRSQPLQFTVYKRAGMPSPGEHVFEKLIGNKSLDLEPAGANLPSVELDPPYTDERYSYPIGPEMSSNISAMKRR